MLIYFNIEKIKEKDDPVLWFMIFIASCVVLFFSIYYITPMDWISTAVYIQSTGYIILDEVWTIHGKTLPTEAIAVGVSFFALSLLLRLYIMDEDVIRDKQNVRDYDSWNAMVWNALWNGGINWGVLGVHLLIFTLGRVDDMTDAIARSGGFWDTVGYSRFFYSFVYSYLVYSILSEVAVSWGFRGFVESLVFAWGKIKWKEDKLAIPKKQQKPKTRTNTPKKPKSRPKPQPRKPQHIPALITSQEEPDVYYGADNPEGFFGN